MERESQVADAAVGQGFLGPLQHAVFAQLGDAPGTEAVQQVEVDRVELQALELLAEVALAVVVRLELPHGQLGRHLEAAAQLGKTGVARSAQVSRHDAQRLAEPALAGAVVVGVGRVHVVDAGLDGAAQHGVGGLDINAPVGARRRVDTVCQLRQPHSPEPQRRRPQVDRAEASILHRSPSPPCRAVRAPRTVTLSVALQPLREEHAALGHVLEGVPCESGDSSTVITGKVYLHRDPSGRLPAGEYVPGALPSTRRGRSPWSRRARANGTGTTHRIGFPQVVEGGWVRDGSGRRSAPLPHLPQGAYSSSISPEYRRRNSRRRSLRVWESSRPMRNSPSHRRMRCTRS